MCSGVNVYCKGPSRVRQATGSNNHQIKSPGSWPCMAPGKSVACGIHGGNGQGAGIPSPVGSSTVFAEGQVRKSLNKSDFQKPKRFDVTPIADAEDRAYGCNHKLKCMGTLLGVADLECFADGYPDGGSHRCGLSCIILEIADEHEKNIELLRADYERCLNPRFLSRLTGQDNCRTIAVRIYTI